MLGGKHRPHRQGETNSAGLKTKLMSLTSFFDALNPRWLAKKFKIRWILRVQFLIVIVTAFGFLYFKICDGFVSLWKFAEVLQ